MQLTCITIQRFQIHSSHWGPAMRIGKHTHVLHKVPPKYYPFGPNKSLGLNHQGSLKKMKPLILRVCNPVCWGYVYKSIWCMWDEELSSNIFVTIKQDWIIFHFPYVCTIQPWIKSKGDEYTEDIIQGCQGDGLSPWLPRTLFQNQYL